MSHSTNGPGTGSGTASIIARTEALGANNYKPLPIVVAKAEGSWVEDPEDRRYLDMLSAYSALNFGHRHPRIIGALKAQADRLTLTSRAFHNDRLAEWYEKLSALTGKNCIVPMNTGAEAVETAIKAARRWAYRTKNVPPDEAEIIVCEGNFHGRTVTITSFSSEDEYKKDFGPFTPGFRIVPFGDIDALRNAITPATAAFLVEPIQGEAGIRMPPEGYLRAASALCRERNVLFVADEIQTGFGRTGVTFACEAELVEPDVYVLGKALGGGVMPVSAVAADRSVLGVFDPGSHGSTFGGNPLACAVSIEAMNVLAEEGLVERSAELGRYFAGELRKLKNDRIKEIRGRGLFVGLELTEQARPYCESLQRLGVLCKETHGTTIRVAPPLTTTKDELDFALERIRIILNGGD
ncbi:ornithine--oxo-acid transaminase [Cohnella suwonensis]|uniref:Ornithine aminotransferase n=1 Tax=Cohnella suwonensis TaxID=696072 RepID=A0ABW0LZF4_9BACL